MKSIPHWNNMTTKERRRYVNQDEVKLNTEEICFDPSLINSIIIENHEIWSFTPITSPEVLKTLILQLHNDGKSIQDIEYFLPCSRSYIYRVLRESK